MDFGAHGIIWMLLVGLVIGAIAKLLMPGRDPGGCIITMLLGIAGAFVGTWLGKMFTGNENYTAQRRYKSANLTYGHKLWLWADSLLLHGLVLIAGQFIFRDSTSGMIPGC